MNSYFRVRIKQISASMEDIITTHAFEHGASGVSEALSFTQTNLTYDAEVLYPKTHDIDVFFPENPSVEFFNGLKELDAKTQWQIFEEEHKDWLEEWKKGFVAFKLVQDIWVIPSWLPSPAEAKLPIFIDPGMAFGTGTHATTQLAAALIYKAAKKDSSPASLLDVGTGTAILALLAEKLNFTSIVGVEIDPEARRVAKENIVKNKSKNIQILEQQVEELHDQFDVVVANIIDGVLIHLKTALIQRTKIDGSLIVTGILKEHDDEFFENFTRETSLKVMRRIEKDEWVGYWFQNSSSTES